MLSLLILALPVCALPAQEPEATTPLPAKVAARLNEVDIPMQDYLEYLYRRFGKKGVHDLVGEMLVEKEAQKYGIVIADAEVESKLEERLKAAQGQQDEAAFLEGLHRNGQSLAMYRAGVRQEIRQNLLQRALVLKTRVATDDRVQQFFERKYGMGGVRLRVRHVLVMPNILRAEKVRAGTRPADIDMEALKVQARAQCEQARQRLLAGEDFATVAADLSHDRVTRDRGGEIQNYNGRLYGPAFRNALNQLQAGQISGVIESGAGFHVVKLLERKSTKLEDVLDEITQEILTAEPTYQEMAGLKNSLIDAADLQVW